MILGPYLTSALRLLLPPEFQRDLAAAERSLQSADDPARLLQLGKVLLCAGKVKPAREALNRANSMTIDQDASQKALVGAYRLLVELADFGACRDWGPARPPLELARRWSLTGWRIERDAWFRGLPRLPALVHDEVWLVTQIAPLVNELAAATAPTEIEGLQARLTEASRRLEAGELPDWILIGMLATRAAVTMVYNDWAEAERLVAVATQRCRELGHGLGEALFNLFGHELSTTRSTVPAALDLYAADPSAVPRTLLALTEDAREATPRPMAGRFVDWGTTRDALEANGWDVGVAAGLVMEASWTNRAKPRDMPATLEIQALVNAKTAFERAGDDTGRQLVDCHLCILGLEQNYPMQEYLAIANHLGRWGKEVGSTSFTVALGLLLLAIERRWQRRGHPERALHAVRLARAVFEGLDAPAACADAAFQEAEVLEAVWEPASAAPSLSRAFEGYRRLLTDTGPPDPGNLEAWWQARNRLARAAARQLASATNLAAVERTRDQLTELGALSGAAR